MTRVPGTTCGSHRTKRRGAGRVGGAGPGARTAGRGGGGRHPCWGGAPQKGAPRGRGAAGREIVPCGDSRKIGALGTRGGGGRGRRPPLTKGVGGGNPLGGSKPLLSRHSETDGIGM